MNLNNENPQFLFNPNDVRDNCGVGLIANIHNKASHEVVNKAFEALGNLVHRGAIDADGKTGDGAGILSAIPKQFYYEKAQESGVTLPANHKFAVAMIFFPQSRVEMADCRRIIEEIYHKYDLHLLWSREVPLDVSVLGQKAKSTLPIIYQEFVDQPKHLNEEEFEQLLYLVRKEIEAIVIDRDYQEFYIPSFSTRTIVHKGLFVGNQVRDFYLDLKDQRFVSAFVVFHQRFSTNTFPTWPLAQPFRALAHNGEINTIRGNRNWMYAREKAEQPKSWVPDDYALKHIVVAGHSDSASFDNALEAYLHAGRTLLHSVVHMLPEAWQNQKNMTSELRAFYEYHACIGESWDGPAAVAFTDGKFVGAILDRNGLRPARYQITKDYLAVCSEMGCLRFPDEDVLENGKLAPGKVIAVDLVANRILFNDDIKKMLSVGKSYKTWIDQNIYRCEVEILKKQPSLYQEDLNMTAERVAVLQRVFGYTQEDHDLILEPMFEDGKEPVGSMGDDTPLAMLSQKPRLLYTYFKQLFAQVTNPPIDPIREEFVTSLKMYLGKSGNIYEETPLHAKQMQIDHPVVTSTMFQNICQHPDFPSVVLDALFPVQEGPTCIEDRLQDLCHSAEQAVDKGAIIVILSDRNVDKNNAPLPMLAAVAAVHHHLTRVGKRLRISLVVETAEAREVHHFACLIGYGASVIYPYLALNLAKNYAQLNNLDPQAVIKKYIYAVETGLLKILSKMGISTLQSYHGAQVFEAIGLKNSVVHHYFNGTPTRISGVDLAEIAEDYLGWHQYGFTDITQVLDIGGHYRFRRQGEYHAFNPDVVKQLQKAVNHNSAEAYKNYAALVNQRTPITIRDLLKVKTATAVPLESVESAESLYPRFNTPGISYGAISKETHETFAIAMNRIGGKSDSGEGGENPERYQFAANGDSKNSAIKQVASGRFGVTAYYLSQAQELEIKIAQGAKPGEGGQLPGHKVSEEIALVRHSTPGVTLISPPPHHDIYSIEDLAQLIYDLKQANPKARVCVKLVSEAGVGTIAAGVAKAHADSILISGHDGGTGASPLSSIKHAGLPWELGLAETQQVLVYNNLRSRILLKTDGGLKTGLDVVKAALLGAEEYGFGTVAMVATGCVMVRQCHMNTCPVGVATQDPKLRAKYKGTPEHIVNLFRFIAEEIRQILAEMGFKSLTQIIGRTDLLEQVVDVQSKIAKNIDLKPLLARADFKNNSPLYHTIERNDWVDDVPFDTKMIQDSQAILASGSGELKLNYDVVNTDRSVGAQLSHEIVKKYGPEGLPQGTIKAYLNGIIGQSFGVFTMKSVELHLSGSANDYVGKGLCGGILSVKPSAKSSFKPEENVIAGNTCLYGATSGSVFINGLAGERFAVRNSGANAVVEGIGDHGCEYMTGGKVLILGQVGNNFGAGMTGGVAYIYNKKQTLAQNHNPSETQILPINWQSAEAEEFINLLKQHVALTGSPLGKRLLSAWAEESQHFVRVYPKELLMREALTEKLTEVIGQ